MELTSVTTGPAPTIAAPPSKISSDFTTFLKMLTVQMQNQDPMKPIESSDYAVQLATFSGVEQQVRTNQLLEVMSARFAQMGMTEMAGWIGREARVDAPVHFEGDPVTLSPNPALGATRAVLVVKDAAGSLVSREDIPVSAAPYQWLGTDAAGNPLTPGTYDISLESMRDDTLIANTPIEHYARVIEARGTPAGTRLVLPGGFEVAATSVTALRLPQ